MKKGIAIALVALVLVGAGALSMGCIDKEVTVTSIPTIAPIPSPTPEVITVVVIETVVDVTESEVEVITYKEYPTLVYSGCYVEYPDNVAGFDTPCERAAILQAELNGKLDMVYDGKITQQRYQYRGEQAFIDFYTEAYQDKLDKYVKLYCGLGNRILTDSNEPVLTWVDAYDFTSPWGPRNLGNGSFEYDTYRGTVSFVGEEIASGGAVTVNASGAVIDNMYYTYMGNNATLPGETEITF